MPVAARDAGMAKRGAAGAPAPRARAGAAKRQAPPSGKRDGAGRSAAARRAKAPGGKRPSAASPASTTRAALPVGAGIVWGVALLGAVAASSFLTAVVVGVVAVVATASGIRATEARLRNRGRRRSSPRARRPSTLLVVALAAAALDPLVALGGAAPAAGFVVLSGGLVAAMILASGYAASARPLRAAASRLVAAIAPGLAAASVVVARHQGSNLALALACSALAYDVGAFLMGNSRTPLGGPAGVIFGILSVAVVAVFVAAVMDPPFSGSRPWVVFALVAVAAPLGVRLGQVVGERLPAVRRVDSLFVMAPVWVVAVAMFLHR